MKNIILIFLICLFSAGLNAQPRVESFFPESIWGGKMNAIAVDPNNENVLYAGSDYGGVFKFYSQQRLSMSQ